MTASLKLHAFLLVKYFHMQCSKKDFWVFKNTGRVVSSWGHGAFSLVCRSRGRVSTETSQCCPSPTLQRLAHPSLIGHKITGWWGQWVRIPDSSSFVNCVPLGKWLTLSGALRVVISQMGMMPPPQVPGQILVGDCVRSRLMSQGPHWLSKMWVSQHLLSPEYCIDFWGGRACHAALWES